MHNKSIAPLLVIGLSLAGAATAGFQRRGAGNVEFKATGPGGLTIVGHTTDVDVNESAEAITVVVPLANLSTGIGLRDKHMREKYLEVPKFPTAELTVAKSALHMPGNGDASGTLKLHGVSKPVSVHYETARTGEGMAVIGKMHLDMKEFGIEVPSYLGVTVKPDVDTTVSFNVANDGK